ncbi:MAG: domain S-box [Rariglobus sp.]|jgi:signal transduction histidine kinase|nr:domain S-box [Rariglobus sp.]
MNPENTILVVDDNEHNRYVHVRYLERAGFDVRQASSGAEGLNLAPEADLVILDVRLPDMSGFEVCRQLRQNAGTSAIPVLQTSAAFTAVGDRVVGLQQGADAYLCIPVEADELIATVRALLRTRQAEINAQTMAAEWQLTFDAITDGICLLTEELAIARHNRAFSTLMNHSEPLIGRMLTEVLTIDDPAALVALTRTAAGGQLELPAGERCLNVRIDTVQSSSLPGSKVCIVTDVTRMKATQESLRQAEARLAAHAAELESRVEERTLELHERNSELEAFTYSISHDLRAPLRAMHNFVDVLLEEAGVNLTPLHKDYLKRIGRAAQRMDQLTIDMLHYSQLGRSELSLEPVELEALVERLVDERRERAEAATARFQIDRPLPNVFANEAGLAQALGNLIDNALKFTRPGVATVVRCSAHRDGSRVVIAIEDNGIGIDARHFKKIFMPFERLNPSQSVPGTGIGLAIVQRCIDKMGGQIDVSSVPGEGTTFSITLPAG